MFKALAEFVMRGRLQAVSIVLVGSWFPLVSQAAMGLVTLRKGWQEGLLLTLWGCLPALLAYWIGQVGTAVSVATLLVFVVAYLSAIFLRINGSWSATFSAIVAMSAFGALLVMALAPDLAEQISAFFKALFDDNQGELPEEVRAMFLNWNIVSASGLIAFWIGMTTVLGLLLARWWQGLLFNPGGFQKEFWALRLPLPITLVSAGAWLYCLTRGADFFFWQQLFGLPMLFAGLGLIHWMIDRFKKGQAPLVILYVGLMVVPIVGPLIMVSAIVDTVLNVRNKFETNQPPQQ